MIDKINNEIIGSSLEAERVSTVSEHVVRIRFHCFPFSSYPSSFRSADFHFILPIVLAICSSWNYSAVKGTHSGHSKTKSRSR